MPQLYKFKIMKNYHGQWGLILTLQLLFIAIQSINLPASFTVVRNIATPLSISSFLNLTGCCMNDTYNNFASYTHISLDGFKSTSTSTSLQTSSTPIGFWLNANSAISGFNPVNGNTTAAVQQLLLSNYHSFGVKLLLNAFADEAPISSINFNAPQVAQNLIALIQMAQLDGVSIQFQDYHAVAVGTASAWLQQLLSQLRQTLPKAKIVLILPSTFINKVPLLQQPIINAYVDLFVLRYHGYNQQDYTDYNSLFISSIHYPQTAISQLLKNNNVGINLCRTLISKPASSNKNGFINSSTLANAFTAAMNNIGWVGGYANLDFESDISTAFQRTVLQPIRNSCLLGNHCFCR